jgi:hypothetical protein
MPPLAYISRMADIGETSEVMGIPAFLAAEISSLFSWIVTLIMSMGWMIDVARQPDSPPITNGCTISNHDLGLTGTAVVTGTTFLT